MLFRPAIASFAFLAVLLAAVRITVVPPESCGKTGADHALVAASQAAAWIKQNQLPEGRYVYLYNADSNEIGRDYNEVRHAGVTMSLYQAAGRLHDHEALQAADDGLAWMLSNLQRRHGWAALAPDGSRASLGASALMLVSLAERRLATGDVRYDGDMRALASFIVSLQRPDGGFHIAYDLDRDAPDTIGTSRYYPGEALWALALTHEAFPGEGWDEPARRALTFITTLRDEVEDVAFPPLADQWAAYSIAEMVDWGLTDSEVEYARRLAARFGLLVRTEAQREGSRYGSFLRGRDSRAAGTGTWAEGLAALWRASARDPRLSDLKPALEARLACVAGILADRQVDRGEAALYPQPLLAAGAWFRAGETRMDDQQHALSGLIYAADAANDNPVREPSGNLAGDPP